MLTPVCDNSQDVCKEVLSSIVNSSSANPHIDELRRLIQKPQFKVSNSSLTLTKSNFDFYTSPFAFLMSILKFVNVNTSTQFYTSL